MDWVWDGILWTQLQGLPTIHLRGIVTSDLDLKMGAERLQIATSKPKQTLPEVEWEALRERLARSVVRVCPSWLSDRRDDLVQTSIMKVMAVLEKSEGDRELGASYLSRVAYSALVDEIRRLRRRHEVPLDDEETGEIHTATIQPDPESSSMGRQVSRGIQDCLSAQVQSRRVAVILSLQGYSVPEAARQLGWTVKKTENLVYRGIADLRRCLNKKGLQP